SHIAACLSAVFPDGEDFFVARTCVPRAASRDISPRQCRTQGADWHTRWPIRTFATPGTSLRRGADDGTCATSAPERDTLQSSLRGGSRADRAGALVRRIPIRTKLGLALAVPLTAMGVVTLLEVVGVAADADEVRAQTQLATTALGPQGLLTALQNDRNWASSHLIGAESQVELEVESYEGTRAATDKARADFERELAGGSSTAREAYAPALRSLDEVTTLRSDVDALAAGNRGFDNVPAMTEIFDRYTELIEPFFGSMSRISVAMDDPDLDRK